MNISNAPSPLSTEHSTLSQNGNHHKNSLSMNYSNIPQNGFVKNIVSQNQNNGYSEINKEKILNSGSNNNNNNNPNVTNMNFMSGEIVGGALVAKPAITTTPERTVTPPHLQHQHSQHSLQPQYHSQHQQAQQQEQQQHHHQQQQQPQQQTLQTSANGHVNGIKNLQHSVQNLAQNLLLQNSVQNHLAQNHIHQNLPQTQQQQPQQQQPQQQTNNQQSNSVLFYEVTPPKSNGMTEAERKVEALTKEIEKEMEENEPIGDYFGICCACGEKVLGVIDACQAMGNLYHTNCFTCCSCGRPLRGKNILLRFVANF